MKTKLILTTAALFITMPSALAKNCCGGNKGQTSEKKSVKQKLTNKTYSSYLQLSSALFKDDLGSAKKMAAIMAKKGESNTIRVEAAKLAKSKNIKSARSVYHKISKIVVAAAKGNTNYKRAHCPMANGGKGGYWLQKSSDKKVNNPYFGASMAHCGSFK